METAKTILWIIAILVFLSTALDVALHLHGWNDRRRRWKFQQLKQRIWMTRYDQRDGF